MDKDRLVLDMENLAIANGMAYRHREWNPQKEAWYASPWQMPEQAKARVPHLELRFDKKGEATVAINRMDAAREDALKSELTSRNVVFQGSGGAPPIPLSTRDERALSKTGKALLGIEYTYPEQVKARPVKREDGWALSVKIDSVEDLAALRGAVEAAFQGRTSLASGGEGGQKNWRGSTPTRGISPDVATEPKGPKPPAKG